MHTLTKTSLTWVTLMYVCQGYTLQMLYELRLRSFWNLFCSYFNFDDDTKSQFFIWHNNWAVVACAKLWPGMIITSDLYERMKHITCLSGLFCGVCVFENMFILTFISYVIYGSACLHLAHFSCDNCENIFIHCQKYESIAIFLRVMSWNDALYGL